MILDSVRWQISFDLRVGRIHIITLSRGNNNPEYRVCSPCKLYRALVKHHVYRGFRYVSLGLYSGCFYFHKQKQCVHAASKRLCWCQLYVDRPSCLEAGCALLADDKKFVGLLCLICMIFNNKILIIYSSKNLFEKSQVTSKIGSITNIWLHVSVPWFIYLSSILILLMNA